MKWGEITWIFLHSLSVNISTEKYDNVKQELFNHIRQLCNNLPCPMCTTHATAYMSRFKTFPPTKDNLITFLYTFHNDVNRRNNKAIESFDVVQKYSTVNLTQAFHSFWYVMTHQPYNPRFSMSKYLLNMFFKSFYLLLTKHSIIQPRMPFL